MTNDKIVETVYGALPYPEQIKNLNTSYDSSIRFDWRCNTYKVSESLFVEQIVGCMAERSDKAILMQKVIQNSISL